MFGCRPYTHTPWPLALTLPICFQSLLTIWEERRKGERQIATFPLQNCTSYTCTGTRGPACTPLLQWDFNICSILSLITRKHFRMCLHTRIIEVVMRKALLSELARFHCTAQDIRGYDPKSPPTLQRQQHQGRENRARKEELFSCADRPKN